MFISNGFYVCNEGANTEKVKEFNHERFLRLFNEACDEKDDSLKKEKYNWIYREFIEKDVKGEFSDLLVVDFYTLLEAYAGEEFVTPKEGARFMEFSLYFSLNKSHLLSDVSTLEELSEINYFSQIKEIIKDVNKCAEKAKQKQLTNIVVKILDRLQECYSNIPEIREDPSLSQEINALREKMTTEEL